MDKTFTKSLFILLISLFVIATSSFAQTITVGIIDPGPYGQGSSISIPFHVDNTSGCISRNNIYTLYLSDASGSFAAATNLGSISAFYATFMNGIIPAGTPAGTGYKLRIQSSSPVAVSTASAPFTISTSAGVTAGVSSQIIDTSKPEVFGVCVADPTHPPAPYDFINTSTAGATVSATFLNELTQSQITRNIPTSFAADFTNYTIIVKAAKGGIIGTKGYTLINNTLYRNFGGIGDNTYCLGAVTPAAFNIAIDNTSQTGEKSGLRYNYPGLTYKISWGDNATQTFTYCEMAANTGTIFHNYTSSSCGNRVNGQNNVFKVDFTPVNPFCNSTVTTTAYAKILMPPTNLFQYPENACTGTPVTFTNNSDPGQDPNNTGPDCKNNNALYTWLVNGQIIKQNYTLSQPFVYTFPTHGNYTVTLRLQNANSLCPATDVTHSICIQNKPTANFTIPAIRCLADGPLTPSNTSVVDETCNINTYTWKLIDGPVGGVTFNSALKVPQFAFNKTGIYSFQLQITSLGCDPELSPIQTIVVNDAPNVTLSPNTTLCGVNIPISFDPSATETRTVIEGTAKPEANTYTWALTNGATFATGSNSHTQYPNIIFPVVGVYTVTVTHQNNCGSVTRSQQIKIANGPSVTAVATTSTICEGTNANLTGSPGVGGIITSVKWTSTTGGSFGNANTTITTYTPSATDIAAGKVVLTYTVNTSLGGDCASISKDVTVMIVKKATIISSSTPSAICSGNTFNYLITAANTATTFTWTATATSGTATGYTATGNGNTINDIITNAGNTDAIITYTILPKLNGCDGTPFTLKVTVHPLPVITAMPVAPQICSNEPANIALTSNVPLTTYTWTSVTTNGITGNTNPTIPATTTSIQDMLVNPSVTPGTVTYIITPYTGTCTGTPKQVVITVNPQIPLANAGNYAPICNVPSITLAGNNPAPFTGEWSQDGVPVAGVVIEEPNNPNTLVTGLIPGNTYKFKWTIYATPPCTGTNSAVATITVGASVTPNFTSQTQVCGPQQVIFTNTSTPDLPGTAYKWDFGDGTFSTDKSPSKTFTPNADGTDVIRTVSLTITNNCTPQPPKTVDITVSQATPVVVINPSTTEACGSLSLTVQNLSPGTNKQYDFYLIDENGVEKGHITKFDKAPAIFPTVPILNNARWYVYMEALNNCDIKNPNPIKYPIDVAQSTVIPIMSVKDNQTTVCLGSPVTFLNLTANATIFSYRIYNEAGNFLYELQAGQADYSYIFPNIGKYKVSINASNTGCGAAESDKHSIEVVPLPQPEFTYTVDVNNEVTFANTTPDVGSIPASSLTYQWNFGDGSPVDNNYTPAKHFYSYEKSPYTVTLTAIAPGSNCSDIKTHIIEIKFNGELFLPNAFQPASSKTELRTFKAKGQKLREWHMQIFNNWGQLVWQTTELNSNGEPVEGWDGTYKGAPAQQGVYVWQITAKFLNGSDWKGMSYNGSLPKRTGVIHLIR